MAVVDSYCEWLLANHGSSVVVLEDGLSEDKYLERLDILIKNLFSQLTEYTEEEYRSGKAALLLLKKYCFSKRTYGNASQDAAFAEYSAATQAMIDDELKRMESIHNGTVPVADTEKLFTIVTNTLQLMTSVVLCHEKKKDEKPAKTKAKVAGVELPIMVDVQKEIKWEREDTKLLDVIPYLDSVFAISESFEKSKKNINAPRKIISEWAEFRYLRIILQLTKMKLDEMEVF